MISKIVSCSLLLLVSGCADIKFNDEDRKQFLQKTYNTTDVKYYKFEGSTTPRWLVRTSRGEVLFVRISSTSTKLKIESSDTIFTSLRD